MHKYLLIIIFFIVIGCKPNKPVQQQTITQVIDSVKTEQPKIANQFLSEFEMFCNIEQIEYCVPIPIGQYKEDTKHDYERAQHVFQNKADKKYDIIVQGYFRPDDSKSSLQEYFDRTYEDAEQKLEQEGKIIQEKQLVKATNCFYVKGYYSNFELDSRFIEITWLRKDDVVKYVTTFAIKDTAVWSKRLEIIITCSSDYK